MTKNIEKITDYLKSQNPRESYPFYIGENKAQQEKMLQALGLKTLDDLFSHIPKELLFQNFPQFKSHTHEEIIEKLLKISEKNHVMTSFIGDGLPAFSTSKITNDICQIRGLTTAYTPYQPERSQGTLLSLWIYQSLISELTGIEAINASFYDRSTCLYEALTCATRLVNTNKVLVSDNIQPQDLAVIKTLAKHTPIDIDILKMSEGKIDLETLTEKLETTSYAGFAFSQINHLGVIENVSDITMVVQKNNAKAIALFDPLTIGPMGLKAPIEYGDKGVDMIVAEAGHLALAPNYGGPGLGLFGIRYHQGDKRSIRQSAGRFVGKTLDIKNKECLSLILSTREQHIRREKATSNICSNQSFVATLVGASLLARGSKEMNLLCKKTHEKAQELARKLLQFKEVSLAFPHGFFNEFTLKIETDIDKLIKLGLKQGLELGVNTTDRLGFNSLKISVFDKHTQKDFDQMIHFFKDHFSPLSKENPLPQIPIEAWGKREFHIPKIEDKTLVDYYQKLGNLNLTPDEAIYPLGSCTMKYNPYINDWAASLKGFTDLHPQSPLVNAQGSLEILYEIQNLFKKITGLHAVTTQPVAGAQGELVGLKMFQAYHQHHNPKQQRKYILIPQTAHGTNPATASMAGYLKSVNGGGILTVCANEEGEISLEDIKNYIEKFKDEIAGIMITNPNTVGIFEKNFKEVSHLIHSIGGLVYMDGANMNAIAGQVDLSRMGVDAVHNNLHKTWSIPHGGGGPGDAIVAVSSKLAPFLPGKQVIKDDNGFFTFTSSELSIGSFHRHHGNFAHKVRCYTYLLALGSEGVKAMSAYATLSARYIYHLLEKEIHFLPQGAHKNPRMHEFIMTLSDEEFKKIESAGLKKSDIIPRIGKLFLDFGFHAPTVAFPETFGLMVEPTESFSKKELEDFTETIKTILNFAITNPIVLKHTPLFAPTGRVNELWANKNIHLTETIKDLPPLPETFISAKELRQMNLEKLCQKILALSLEKENL